jgi:lysophospholipase L1-like esterase
LNNIINKSQQNLNLPPKEKSMKLALLGDSVFDNRNYVNSEEETVQSVFQKKGHDCKLYAVDGAMIEDVYSQVKKFQSDLKSLDYFVISVGGNNALSHLSLVYNYLHLPLEEILLKMKDFFTNFENEIGKLYSHLSKIIDQGKISTTNIYYPCFDFNSRVFIFRSIKEAGQDKKILKIVDHLNQIIKNISVKYGLGYIDINSKFNSIKYYANEIEPSFEGSELLANLILAELKLSKIN